MSVNLGAVEGEFGRPAEGLAVAQGGLRILERTVGPDHDKTAYAHYRLAGLEASLGRYEDAFRSANAALGVLDRIHGPDVYRGLVLAARARAGSALGRAEAIDDAALALGELELGQGDTAHAIGPLQRAVTILESRHGNVELAARFRFALARALWSGGDRKRAHELALASRLGYAGAGSADPRPICLAGRAEAERAFRARAGSRRRVSGSGPGARSASPRRSPRSGPYQTRRPKTGPAGATRPCGRLTLDVPILGEGREVRVPGFAKGREPRSLPDREQNGAKRARSPASCPRFSRGHALSAQHHVQASVTESPPLLGQLTKPFP
jgi:hypothetical protein